MDVVTLAQAQAGIARNERNRTNGLLAPNPGLYRTNGPRTTATSPPTCTVGTANAGSTISGSLLTAAASLPVTYMGAGYVDPGTQGGYNNCLTSGYLTSSVSSAGRMRFEFETDADKLEVFGRNIGAATSQYRVWIDGHPITAGPQAFGVTGGAIYALKIDFGTRGTLHRVLFEAVYVNLVGIWKHPTATVWPTSRPVGPRVLWMGDSFSEGSGGDWWWDSWANKAGEILGWDVWPSAVGSTGYLANGGGGGKVKFRDRADDDITALNPDVIVVCGGINDIGDGYSATQIGVEAALLYAQLRTDNPTAPLIVCGPISPNGITTTGSYTDTQAAIEDAAADYTTLVMDPTGAGSVPATSWITGTGEIGATTGGGNSDYLISSDGTHPSQVGHDYLGRRFAQGLAALL